MKVICLIVLISWAVSVVATPAKQVELFIAAYNQHDIEKMLENTSDEVKWLYNINDTLLLETDGKDALRTAMVSHFEQQKHARSKIKQSITIGDTVAVIEEAFFDDGNSSQCALSIYQIKQHRIHSVTYYAASTCN